MSREELLRRFVRGDREAIAAVARLVRRVVSDRGYWIPRDERDDVIQEAVVRVYQAVASSDLRIERDFQGYVRTVAHHGCVDWIRRHRPAEPVNPGTASPAPGPEAELAARERLERGRRVLRMLGASCLRLVRLRVRDRLSHREIAERLGRTEGGVRNQFYKCLERARAIAARIGAGGHDDAVRSEE